MISWFRMQIIVVLGKMFFFLIHCFVSMQLIEGSRHQIHVWANCTQCSIICAFYLSFAWIYFVVVVTVVGGFFLCFVCHELFPLVLLFLRICDVIFGSVPRKIGFIYALSKKLNQMRGSTTGKKHTEKSILAKQSVLFFLPACANAHIRIRLYFQF